MMISRVTSPSTSSERQGAATVALRRGQRLMLDPGHGDQAVRVQSGCLIVETALPARRRQVILVLYPGDTLREDALPAWAGIAVTAAIASTVERLRPITSTTSPITTTSSPDKGPSSSSRLVSRMALHTAALGRLEGGEGLATLLVEQSMALGRPTPGGYTFDNPLSRAEMADYLALNPDTLSRLMTRLKLRGVVAMASRSRVIVKDFDALCAMSPLAGAVIELYRRRVSSP